MAASWAGGASEAELLARTARGDEAAFTELIHRHGELLRRVAWRILRHSAEAEDVAQESLVTLWQEASRIRGASVRPWLIQVASRRAFARLRRRAPELVAELPERMAAEDTAGPVLRAEAGRCIDAALARLPERQRLAIVLVYLEGLEQRVAAEALDISRDGLESLLARARQGLRALLADDWRDLLSAVGEASA